MKKLRLRSPSQKVIARDAGVPLAGYENWNAPEPTYEERVYYHQEMQADENGRLTVSIHNPQFPVLGGETAVNRSPLLEAKPITQAGAMENAGSRRSCVGHRTSQLLC